MTFNKITQTLYTCTTRLCARCTICPYGKCAGLDKEVEISTLDSAAIILTRNTIASSSYRKNLVYKIRNSDCIDGSITITTCKRFLEDLSDAIENREENEDQFPFETKDIVRIPTIRLGIVVTSPNNKDDKNVTFLGYKKKCVGPYATIKTERYTYYFTRIAGDASYQYDGWCENI